MFYELNELEIFRIPSTSFTSLVYQFAVIDSSHWLIASSNWCEEIIWVFFVGNPNPSLECFLWVLRQKTLDSISCLFLLHFYLLSNFTPCCPDILNFKMKNIDDLRLVSIPVLIRAKSLGFSASIFRRTWTWFLLKGRFCISHFSEEYQYLRCIWYHYRYNKIDLKTIQAISS